MLRRAPFTLALAAALLAVAALASGPGWAPRPDIIARWGFALHDLWTLRAWSLVTAVFFTQHPARIAATVAFTAASVGVYEWQAGTRRALALFWTADVAATLLLALGVVLPLLLAGTAVGARLAAADDVGMSGGGFACLGAWTARLPQRWRWAAFGAVALFIGVNLFQPGTLEADLLHAIAFPLGVALDRAATRRAVGRNDALVPASVPL